MKLSPQALRVPYTLVRTPVALFDDLVVTRVFGADSAPHRVLARGLATMDDLATRVFEQAPPVVPAETLIRPPTRRRAPRAAMTSPVPASETAPEPAAADAQSLDAEAREQITERTEETLAQEDVASYSGELAEDGEIRRAQAEIAAKQAVEDERGLL